MYANENNVQREVDRNKLVISNWNEQSWSFLMFHFLHSWSVPKYFATKRETQVGIQHSFDVVFSVLLELEGNIVVFPNFRKHFWKPNT